ncbi:MAG TPA: rhomboid family intramembrane serine protease [Planctomycetaceae bacterium]|nr:rhomboid family intramembrane serine protease [Planctomycetaceae bacterium]
MGIYDRDYYREPRPGVALRGPRTVLGWIILVNVIIYLADGLLTRNNLISYWMAVHVPGAKGSFPSTLFSPWLWWQFLTYGFAHAPSPGHILGNMLVLFFLGRDVEARYGPREFLRFYLVTVVVSALVWAVTAELIRDPAARAANLVGASGAVTGVVILFALNFPHRTVLLMFVIPIPAWLLGVLYVLADLAGATGWTRNQDVAYMVHLAGAGFALLYYRFHWNLTRRLPLAWFKRRPRLRVHHPNGSKRDDLSQEVDRILEKIHREGEESLTRKERRILETASRRYQERHRKP